MENKSESMNDKIIDRIQADSDNAIQAAGNAILYGGVIVYPTDTLYGFGVDARNESAIQRLNKIKRRSAPMSVIAPNASTVLSWTCLLYTSPSPRD